MSLRGFFPPRAAAEKPGLGQCRREPLMYT